MIFFACAIAMLVFFGIAFLFHKLSEKVDYYSPAEEVVSVLCFFSYLAFAASLIASIVMLICIIVENTGTVAKLEDLRQQGEILEYQLENDLYDNDNDLGKKELYSEIENYNSTIVKGKAMQNDFWYGIFYPDIYDHLEPIDYKK